MSERRHITQTTRGMPTHDGAGVSLTRLIGTTELPDIDPILMLDNFGSEDPKAYIAGFPSHPHRGFETVSYMIAGSLKHKDNKGGEGLITDGGVQWMTAGRGVVHSEMPEQTSGLMFGFQLWLNLPAAEKMGPPWYQDIPAARIPQFDVDHKARAKLIAGTWGEHTGPGPARATSPFIADVTLNAGGSVTIPVPQGHAGFIYVFQGEAKLGPVDAAQLISKGQLGVLSDGDTIEASTRHGARLLIVAGKPLREPIAKHGPFVMNTMDELRQAVSDYQRGQF
jgi:redox-sensitive bicupin YhaK (pirin superfamily)